MAAALPADAANDARNDWIRRHQAAAWRYVRLCGCSADVADDLVQEALLAALHKRIPERPDAMAAAWLRIAVSNLWRMHLRTSARRAQHWRADSRLAEAAYVQCAADDGGSAWRSALRACLERLDGRARQVLDLHYASRVARADIAATMGLRPDGVKTLLRRVRDTLRSCILRRLDREQEAKP